MCVYIYILIFMFICCFNYVFNLPFIYTATYVLKECNVVSGMGKYGGVHHFLQVSILHRTLSHNMGTSKAYEHTDGPTY